MQTSFAKVDSKWGVKLAGGIGEATGKSGQTVTVSKRDGGSKTVKLGPMLQQWNAGRSAVYEIDYGRQPREEQASRKPKQVTVSQPGVYETPEGTIYVVKPTRDKQRLYAKRLVEINSERLNELGDHVEIEFEYEAGAVYKLTPSMKMPLDRAKELTLRYRRCIVCGLKLKKAESVERGIGPVCIKSFAPASVPTKLNETFSEWSDQELSREIACARNRRDAFPAGREPQEVLTGLANLLSEQDQRRQARR